MPSDFKSPYSFAIVDPGQRFPRAIISSGESGPDLLGHYSLRQAGLDPDDDYVGLDPILRLLGPARDFTKDTWILDSWSPPTANSGERARNLALVVKGLPHPHFLGRRGLRYISALERELAILGESARMSDKEGLNFHAGLISAILGELDNDIAQRNLRLKASSRVAVVVTLIGFATAIASFLALLLERTQPFAK